MLTAEEMKLKIQELKNEAQSLLDANNVEKAENITLEMKILSSQVEIQDKLELTETELVNLKGDFTAKDEEVTNLTSELDAVKNEKTEMMEKYNSATETVTELKAKVKAMQPIVDQYHEKQKEEKLNSAKEDYKAKFDKIGGLELFETEEIQNLVADTINEDQEVSNKAKYTLSEKIMEVIDSVDIGSLSIKSIQEPSNKTKNLDVVNDEFEQVYGFKKE